MSKIIGIPGSTGKDSNNFGVNNDYLEYASRFGDVRIIMPWEQKVDLDLLLLPGGMDTEPMNYGQVPRYNTTNADVFKDFFFKQRLHLYIDNTPIVGICLGMQQLATYFGSDIVQDLIFHEQSSERWGLAHKVFKPSVLVQEEKTNKLFISEEDQKKMISVNSHHHQGVINKGLGADLTPLLGAILHKQDLRDAKEKYNDDYVYIVEAFRHNVLPIIGVQFHPEQLYDQFTINLIKEIIRK